VIEIKEKMPIDATSDAVASEETWHGGDGYAIAHFETEDKGALSLLREDIGRQLGLASDRQNTLLQSIGVLIAFASIVFLQLMTMNPVSDWGGVLSVASMGFIALCCAYGIFTILLSSGFTLSAGMRVEEERDIYDSADVKCLEVKIVAGISKAYDTVYQIRPY